MPIALLPNSARLRSSDVAAAAVRWAATIALLSVTTATTPVLADNCGNDKPVGNAQVCQHDAPGPSATPELGSLLLFGMGLTGVGGYAVARLRRRGRQQ
jgi:hypothetical protein